MCKIPLPLCSRLCEIWVQCHSNFECNTCLGVCTNCCVYRNKSILCPLRFKQQASVQLPWLFCMSDAIFESELDDEKACLYHWHQYLEIMVILIHCLFLDFFCIISAEMSDKVSGSSTSSEAMLWREHPQRGKKRQRDSQASSTDNRSKANNANANDNPRDGTVIKSRPQTPRAPAEVVGDEAPKVASPEEGMLLLMETILAEYIYI